MKHTRRLHRLPAVFFLTVGLGAGAACSGSGSDDGVASLKTASDTKNGSGSNDDKDTEKTDPEDAMLAFARCMRENGVDMPDPDTSGGPGIIKFGGPASAGQKLDVDGDRFQAAHKACERHLGDARPQNLSPEEQQEMQDRALAFSRCMRDHGIDMPDPQFGGEGQVMMRIGPDTGVDPSDPKFTAAQQACGAAFGPKGAEADPEVSVGGGGKPGGAGGKAGTVFFGAPASGGAK